MLTQHITYLITDHRLYSSLYGGYPLFENALIFILLLVALTLLSIWCYLQKNTLSDRLRPRLLTIWGASLVLAAFLLLPWLSFKGRHHFDEHFQELWQNQAARLLIENDSTLSQLFGAAQPESIEGFIANISPAEQKLIRIARTRQRLTGFELWYDTPNMGTLLHIVLTFMLIIPICALVASWLSFRATSDNLSIFTMAYNIFALLTFLLTIGLLPTIDTLGIREKGMVTAITFLAGASHDYGIWAALLGLVLLIIAGITNMPSFDQDGNDPTWFNGSSGFDP